MISTAQRAILMAQSVLPANLNMNSIKMENVCLKIYQVPVAILILWTLQSVKHVLRGIYFKLTLMSV